MTRTNIDIADQLVTHATPPDRPHSKHEAVDLAPRQRVSEPMSREDALSMRGSGWSGDLAEIRVPDEISLH